MGNIKLEKTFHGKVCQWALDRNLLQTTTPLHQLAKLVEEFGELGHAILRDDRDEMIDAIGDMCVVLVQISQLNGFTLEQAQEFAWNEIKDRKGKMVNGAFVKEEDLIK